MALRSTGGRNSYTKEFDLNLKLVIVGDVGVGKTTFLNTFIDGRFSSRSRGDWSGRREKILKHNDKRIRLQIWDTEGQEKYRSITSSYYRGANSCVIVFDVTKRSSFENVTKWKRDVEQYCHNDNMRIVLVGTRSHENSRAVARERAEDLARSADMIYMEVSSETDFDSVVAVFNNILDMVADRMHKGQITSIYQKPLQVSFHNNKCCSCCY